MGRKIWRSFALDLQICVIGSFWMEQDNGLSYNQGNYKIANIKAQWVSSLYNAIVMEALAKIIGIILWQRSTINRIVEFIAQQSQIRAS